MAPVFLVDRSLGRKRLPEGLRAAGWQLVTLAEHFGQPHDETVADVTWLAEAGRRGWAVLMKDQRIRYRPKEIAALRDARVHAFCLSRGDTRFDDMVALYLLHERAIFGICEYAPGPTFHVISRAGMRSVDLQLPV